MGGLAPLNGEGFLSAYYLNELIIRLCAKEDPHPELFDAYTRALGALAEASGLKVQPILRLFEVDSVENPGLGAERRRAGPGLARQGWGIGTGLSQRSGSCFVCRRTCYFSVGLLRSLSFKACAEGITSNNRLPCRR